jgi:splicing factor 3A subunit 1
MAITGVIRPPPEIRAVADRTALYVAKNGRAFEARILKSEKAKTPKFAFLQPTSPFHAYYEDRIQFYEAGGEDGDDADPNNKKEVAEKKKQESTAPKETVRKTEKTQKASAIDPIAKALLGQRNKIQQSRAKQKEESKEGEAGGPENPPMSLPPPPPLELVTIVAPSNLSVVQIETIQLVAQFAAMDGKGGPFLQQLTLREWTNSAFSFCQPRHAHFAYFSALVDAYRRILGQWTASANSKSMTSGAPLDAQASLQQAAYRAEYERESLQMKSQQEEGEVVAIDWQDFAVVETIDFPVDEKVELSMLPPPPPPKMQEQPSVAAETAHGGMEESDEEDEEETIRVVPTYTPKVVGTANRNQARAIDPITGKSVSVADMPEHMRIQLMDPKWAEERKKFQEKQKDSNLVSGDAIASNISRFAQARGDLFGKSVSLVLGR